MLRPYYPSRRQMLTGAFVAPYASGFIPSVGRYMYNMGYNTPQLVSGAVSSMYKRYSGGSKSSYRPPPQYSVNPNSVQAPVLSRKKKGKKRNKRRKRPSRRVQINRMYKKYIRGALKERTIASGQIESDANKCKYSSISLNKSATLRSILDDAFKQITAVPGEETIDRSTASQGLKTAFLDTKLVVRFKNNSSFGCKLYLWTIADRVQHSNAPLTVYTDGLDSISGGNNGLEVEIPWWPSNSKPFRKFYKSWNYKSIDMSPGAEFVYTVVGPKCFIWDEAKFKTDAAEYFPGMSRHLFFRIQGNVAHSNATDTEVGIGNAQLDYVFEKHYKMNTLEAPDKIERIYHTNSLDTLTTPTQFQTDNAEEVTFAT